LPAAAISTNSALVALRSTAGGAYVCSFESDSGVFDVSADHVILALPFSTLRRVDLSHSSLSPLKMKAIDELGMGSNAKLALQLHRKPWASEGFDGVAYSGPSGFQVVWDATTVQPGPGGILVQFPGGATGRSYRGAAFGPAPGGDVDGFLEQVEPVFPGTTAAFTGRAYRDFWHADPWHRGAYSYFRVGQYTGFSGYEKVPEGNIHFCGEHTSSQFQGYMEGALESADRVAGEIGQAAQSGLSHVLAG
jgi:monoamine oxidase